MRVYLNDPSFDYDIRSLVRAFYPGEDVLFVREKETDEIDLYVEDSLKYSDLPRPEAKNVIKRLVYNELSKRTGRSLPWGTLTGIRPTKLYLKGQKNKQSPDEIHSYMANEYLISPEKSTVAYEIAKREYTILDEMDIFRKNNDSYSLYIGIPFCPSICLYCSFSSYPLGIYKNKVDDYLTALKKEIDYVAKDFSHRRLDTIYIGGGTPTSLTAEQLEVLISYVEEKLNLTDLKEWTIEAGRADSISLDKLKTIKSHWNGDIRISINPQTMRDETLRLIGRAHDAAAVQDAFHMAKSVGINTINMDMIVGLPGEDENDVAYTLDCIKELLPDNLTVHSLAVKRASRLAEMMENYSKLGFVSTQRIMEMVRDAAADMGMSPYYLYRQKDIAGNLENIGYSTPGKEGLYNMLIMEEVTDIVAIGAGAACKHLVRDENGTILEGAKVARCENVKDVDLYISRIDEMIRRKKELYT